MIYLIIAFYFFISEYLLYKYNNKIGFKCNNTQHVERRILNNEITNFTHTINSFIIVGILFVNLNSQKTNINYSEILFNLLLIVVWVVIILMLYILLYKIHIDNYFIESLYENILIMVCTALIFQIAIFIYYLFDFFTCSYRY